MAFIYSCKTCLVEWNTADGDGNCWQCGRFGSLGRLRIRVTTGPTGSGDMRHEAGPR